jgi:hypothetical protein
MGGQLPLFFSSLGTLWKSSNDYHKRSLRPDYYGFIHGGIKLPNTTQGVFMNMSKIILASAIALSATAAFAQDGAAPKADAPKATATETKTTETTKTTKMDKKSKKAKKAGKKDDAAKAE